MFGSPFGVSTPLTSPVQPFPSYGNPGPIVNPIALQHVLQLLQTVPSQLQSLQQQQYYQQQQLQQVQQILQVIPAQLWQIHQLIQFVPQQIQQTPQFQQPFGQSFGAAGFQATPIAPQIFGAQPGHVM
jgi:hypothetical protein